MSSMRASEGTWAPGLESFWPLTRTLPARSRAWARSREGARPRSKMRTSRRVLLGRAILFGERRIACGGERREVGERKGSRLDVARACENDAQAEGDEKHFFGTAEAVP